MTAQTPRQISPRWFILLVILVTLLVTSCTRSAVSKEAVTPPPAGTVGPTNTPTTAPIGVKPGTTAPEFNLHTYMGEEMRLSALRSQPVILYFWNTTCQACTADMAALQTLQARYETNGLRVVGINNKEQSLDVGEFAQANNITFPLLLDREGTIAELYRVRNFPSLFFIDRNGVIAQVSERSMKPEDIDATAQQIIASVAIQPTAAPTSPPVTSLEGCVTADALRVRVGPGTDFDPVGLLPNGECRQFDARNGDSTWLRLADPAEGARQWVSAEFVELRSGEINSLPVGE